MKLTPGSVTNEAADFCSFCFLFVCFASFFVGLFCFCCYCCCCCCCFWGGVCFLLLFVFAFSIVILRHVITDLFLLLSLNFFNFLFILLAGEM